MQTPFSRRAEQDRQAIREARAQKLVTRFGLLCLALGAGLLLACLGLTAASYAARLAACPGIIQHEGPRQC